MSVFYKAAKLARRDMTTELGEMAAEAFPSMTHRGGGGSPEGVALHFYKLMLPFLRTNLGIEAVNWLSYVISSFVYGGWFLIGVIFWSLPLLLLSLFIWATHALLCMFRDRNADKPYSFGKPRKMYWYLFGRFFKGWHYCLFYEPMLPALPLVFITGIHVAIINFFPDVPGMSYTPVLVFFVFHMFILAFVPWFLFSDEAEMELDARAEEMEIRQKTRRREEMRAADKPRATVARRRR